MANILDKENISWNRPKHLLWTDNEGKIRRYHPDFYLPDYKIFLDPKNDYLIDKDAFKINQVSIENEVKVFMVSKNNLTHTWIRTLLETEGIEPF